MTDSDYYIKSRGYKRAQITKLFNNVKNNTDGYTVEQRSAILSRIEQLGDEVRKLNTDIGSVVWKSGSSDDLLQKELEECDSYDQKVIEVVAIIKNLSEPIQVSNSINNSSKLKLPEVPIPYYDHENDNLGQFIVSFEEIVSKYQISEYEKFILFGDHLKGEALSLVKSLESGKQSYKCAKQLLRSAFECEITNKFEVVSRLSKLKLTSEQNTYEFIGEMRTLQNQVSSLDIDIKFRSTVFCFECITTRFAIAAHYDLQ